MRNLQVIANHVASPLHQSKVSSLKMKPKTKLTSWGWVNYSNPCKTISQILHIMQIVFTHNEVNKFNMQGKWIGMNCLSTLQDEAHAGQMRKTGKPYITHFVSTLVRSLQPWFQLMGKWVCYICLLPLKSFLDCFSQIPMTNKLKGRVWSWCGFVAASTIA